MQRSPGASGNSVMRVCLAFSAHSSPTAVCSHRVAAPPQAGFKSISAFGITEAETNLPSLWDYVSSLTVMILSLFLKKNRCYVRTCVDYAIHVLLVKQNCTRLHPRSLLKLFLALFVPAGPCVKYKWWKTSLEVVFLLFLLSLKLESQ